MVHAAGALHMGVGLLNLSVKAVCQLPGERQSGLGVWSDEGGEFVFYILCASGNVVGLEPGSWKQAGNPSRNADHETGGQTQTVAALE